MASTTRRTRNLLRRLIDAFFDAIGNRVPVTSDLRTEAERMNEGLALRSQAASFSMARAEEIRERLQHALEEHDALEGQAMQLLQNGNEREAERCVALQLAAREEVTRLRGQYTQLNEEARRSVATYLAERGEVQQRIRELPELQHEAKIVELQERIQEDAQAFSLEGARNRFDELSRELRLRKHQAASRALLEADPNAELDQKIRATLGQQKVAAAMALLRARMQQQTDGSGVYEVVEDDVQSTRALLEAPGYRELLLPAAPVREREPVPIRQRTEQ